MDRLGFGCATIGGLHGPVDAVDAQATLEAAWHAGSAPTMWRHFMGRARVNGGSGGSSLASRAILSPVNQDRLACR